MSAQPQTKNLDQDIERELARRLTEAQAEHRPAELVLAGRRYHLVPVEDIQETEDPFRNYDPDRVLAAIQASAGALKHLDVEPFLEEIMEMREQDTPGHRWP